MRWPWDLIQGKRIWEYLGAKQLGFGGDSRELPQILADRGKCVCLPRCFIGSDTANALALGSDRIVLDKCPS